MNYLCLAYYNEPTFNGLATPELDTLPDTWVKQCKSHGEALCNSGHLLLAGSLATPQSSASLRPRQGKASVSDGPFTETREQVGAFFVIEARDFNDALRIASRHPAARLDEQVGLGIEIRPIEFFMQKN